jgi:hypothetical protein
MDKRSKRCNATKLNSEPRQMPSRGLKRSPAWVANTGNLSVYTSALSVEHTTLLVNPNVKNKYHWTVTIQLGLN